MTNFVIKVEDKFICGHCVQPKRAYTLATMVNHWRVDCPVLIQRRKEAAEELAAAAAAAAAAVPQTPQTPQTPPAEHVSDTTVLNYANICVANQLIFVYCRIRLPGKAARNFRNFTSHHLQNRFLLKMLLQLLLLIQRKTTKLRVIFSKGTTSPSLNVPLRKIVRCLHKISGKS
jgi:hypothetical protein